MLPTKDELKRSKYLPQKVEDELRTLVIDAGNVGHSDEPLLIIANPDTSCHGTYHVGEQGVEFFFHHNKRKAHDPCACLVEGGPRKPTLELPPELDEFRIDLIEGRESMRMEPLYAAMVIMKIFLGMELPKEIDSPF